MSDQSEIGGSLGSALARGSLPVAAFIAGVGLQFGGWQNASLGLALMALALLMMAVAVVTWHPVRARIPWTLVLQRRPALPRLQQDVPAEPTPVHEPTPDRRVAKIRLSAIELPNDAFDQRFRLPLLRLGAGYADTPAIMIITLRPKNVGNLRATSVEIMPTLDRRHEFAVHGYVSSSGHAVPLDDSVNPIIPVGDVSEEMDIVIKLIISFVMRCEPNFTWVIRDSAGGERASGVFNFSNDYIAYLSVDFPGSGA